MNSKNGFIDESFFFPLYYNWLTDIISFLTDSDKGLRMKVIGEW